MYREIVTRAVIGKGKVSNNGEIIVNTSNSVSKVLGCWVINNYCVSNFEKGKVFAKGKYDIHVWYAYNEDSETTLHKQTIDYFEEFSLKLNDKVVISENNEFVIRCSKYPTCNGLTLKEDGTIGVKVEKELELDVIGETKLKVQVSSGYNEEFQNSEDINNVNVNYLNIE